MPVSKTAERALRSSSRKKIVNSILIAKLEAAIRRAKKTKKQADVSQAISFVDKAAKKHIIHKNKAARMKSSLSSTVTTTTKKSTKASSKKKPKKQKINPN